MRFYNTKVYFVMIALQSSRKCSKTTTEIHHRRYQNQKINCVLQVHQKHNNTAHNKNSSSKSSQLVKLAAFQLAAHMSQHMCAATAATLCNYILKGKCIDWSVSVYIQICFFQLWKTLSTHLFYLWRVYKHLLIPLRMLSTSYFLTQQKPWNYWFLQRTLWFQKMNQLCKCKKLETLHSENMFKDVYRHCIEFLFQRQKPSNHTMDI